jgi:hypothetical protein
MQLLIRGIATAAEGGISTLDRPNGAEAIPGDKTMKPLTLLTISFLLATSSRAQLQPKVRAKAVSLETVLSCQEDELIQSAFTLTEDDMFKLNLLKVGSIPPEATNEKVRAVSHSFNVSPGEDKTWRILPDEKSPSFCHDYLIVGGFARPTGKSYDPESHAAFAKILAYKEWVLDPNEVFKHAEVEKGSPGFLNRVSGVRVSPP